MGIRDFINLIGKKARCKDCVYCNLFGFASSKSSNFSYSCDYDKNDIKSINTKEVDKKFCWKFFKRRIGISKEKQLSNTYAKKLIRNLKFIITTSIAIIGLIFYYFSLK